MLRIFRLASSHSAKRIQRIVVRVWEPDPQSVGHVSLQTDKHYISLWPSTRSDKPKIKWGTFDGELVSSLDDDVEANGYVTEEGIASKEPDAVVSLENLNVDKINVEFEQFVAQEIKWTLIGGNRFLLRSDIHSCASLVLALLHSGGLDEDLLIEEPLTLLHKFIQDNVVVTPSNVRMIVECVRNNENRLPSGGNSMLKGEDDHVSKSIQSK